MYYNMSDLMMGSLTSPDSCYDCGRDRSMIWTEVDKEFHKSSRELVSLCRV